MASRALDYYKLLFPPIPKPLRPRIASTGSSTLDGLDLLTEDGETLASENDEELTAEV